MAGDEKNYSSESAASRFMATVNDDLLLEMLIRLPRLGPAITVCKSWHSLIISDHPKSFLRHTLHHHHRRQTCDPHPSYTPPCTILMGIGRGMPCLQILSEKSMILETVLSRQSPQKNLLGFVSDLNSEAIKASFNDSLLLHLKGEYRIYKPMTGEQLLIPNPPSANDFPKLMLVGSEEPNGIFRFRVVKFQFSGSNSVMVFSSETGQWNESVLKFYPRTRSCQMVAAGGALHWMMKEDKPGGALQWMMRMMKEDKAGGALHRMMKEDIACGALPGMMKEDLGICVYDPFRRGNDPSSCRIFKLPRKTPYHRGYMGLGAVRGRFRLSQMLSDERLRIWELKKNGNDDDPWRLVHQVSLRMEIKGEIKSVMAFHPEDGDVIFVYCGIGIYQCHLKDGEGERFRKVCEVLGVVQFFSLVHPWC